MAYKKYIKKNGKTFGPYYYESYRDSKGKVRKKYVGTTNPHKEEKQTKEAIRNKESTKRNNTKNHLNDRVKMILIRKTMFGAGLV